MKRQVEIYEPLIEKFSKREIIWLCKEYVDNENTKPLDDEIHKAEIYLKCLKNLRGQLNSQLSEHYREQLVRINDNCHFI